MQGRTSQVSLEVYDPSGTIEITELYAHRLKNLDGKTICELSNYSWEYDRTFPMIREVLQRRFRDVKIIPYTEFPDISSIKANVFPQLLRLLREKGCDGIIVGNAA